MAAAGLLAYALVVATVGSRLLAGARWLERAPRVGIAVWQALSVSVLTAVVLGGLSLALPVMPFTLSLAELLRTCVMLLRFQYATPGGAIATTMGFGLAMLVVARAAWCGGRTWVRIAHGRRVQRDHLAVLATRDHATGILLLDHAQAAAYCLPGRGGRHRGQRGGQVVLTTGAIQTLTEPELEAVLAHERAHLAGRHDLVVATATALREAFGFVPLFATAADQVPRLVEMAADDAALRSTDRASLAHALLHLAGAPAPAGLLGAGGCTALARVRRLVAPRARVGFVTALAVLVGLGLVLVLPVALALTPALAVVNDAYCPIIVMG